MIRDYFELLYLSNMRFFEINYYQLFILIILNHFPITKFNFKLVKTLKFNGGHFTSCLHTHTHTQGYTDEHVSKILCNVEEATIVNVDRLSFDFFIIIIIILIMLSSLSLFCLLFLLIIIF